MKKIVSLFLFLGGVDRRFHPQGRAMAAQQLIENLRLALKIRRAGVVVIEAKILGGEALILGHLFVVLVLLRGMAEFDIDLTGFHLLFQTHGELLLRCFSASIVAYADTARNHLKALFWHGIMEKISESGCAGMAVKCYWANESEKQEIIEFIDYVFSKAHRPHDFASLLPKLYGRDGDGAAHHFVIREDGKLAATVLAYPVMMQIGESRLMTLGVGSVSTHPCARGKG